MSSAVEKRLAQLVKNYANDFTEALKKYRNACTQFNVASPKDFLKDASLYKGKGAKLSVRDILDAIAKETERITPIQVLQAQKRQRLQEKAEARKLKKQRGAEEALRRIQSQPPCSECGAQKGYLFLDAKACDNNRWRLPSGREGEGYMPTFTGLTDSDGVCLELCINCGVPKGFDAERLQEELAEVEQEAGDNDGDDDSGLED